jgi:hypothetical protein
MPQLSIDPKAISTSQNFATLRQSIPSKPAPGPAPAFLQPGTFTMARAPVQSGASMDAK